MRNCAMPKTLAFIFSICFFNQISTAQALEPDLANSDTNHYYQRIYIGISGGFSRPMGSFSAHNEEFGNSAYAKAGSNLNALDAGFRIGKTLGVSLSYFRTKNEVSIANIEQNLNFSSVRINSRTAGDYQLNGILVGLLVSKMNNVADMDLKFMLGYANFHIPTIQFEGTEIQNQSPYYLRYQSINKNSLGLGIGMGVRVHMNEYLDFMANTSYLLFQDKFDQLVVENGFQSKNEITLSYEVLTINFGIAYRFLDDDKAVNR